MRVAERADNDGPVQYTQHPVNPIYPRAQAYPKVLTRPRDLTHSGDSMHSSMLTQARTHSEDLACPAEAVRVADLTRGAADVAKHAVTDAVSLRDPK